MSRAQQQLTLPEPDRKNAVSTDGLLSDDLLACIGRTSAPRTEIASRREIRKYSIATGWKKKEYLDGDEAPPLFHLALFWDMVELDKLTPDGVSIDELLPKFPLEKAMAGGLSIDYFRPIMAEDVLVATRTLTNIYEKSGSQGPIIFYEVLMRVETAAGELVLTEKNNTALAVMNTAEITNLKPGDALPGRAYAPDNVQNFMYSAALWNAHRIHFDMPYATEVEGYPGIVMSGPMLGDWLTQCVIEWLDGAGQMTQLEYSNRKAAYIGETVTSGGRVLSVDHDKGSATLEVFIKNEAGDVIVPGTAVVAFDKA